MRSKAFLPACKALMASSVALGRISMASMSISFNFNFLIYQDQASLSANPAGL